MIRREDQQLFFADINVWFFKKNCPESITEAKAVWDQLTVNMIGKASLDDFLRKYSQVIVETHSSYKDII